MNKHFFQWLLAAFLLGISATEGISLSYGEDEQISPHALGERDGRHNEHGLVPKLYDARGGFVGEIVMGSMGNDPGAVVINVNGASVYVKLTRLSKGFGFPESATQMVWSDNSIVSYDGANCTGAPYVFPDSVLRPAAIVREGAKVTLLIGAEGPAENHTIVSGLILGQCVGNDPYVDTIWRVESTVDLSVKHPEPLRVGF
ncbi:hypothetical protein [Caballeronia grimmiae]|uniref:hypothetical protein n=1 Tax=Caballeronia grimmiae TaxID=1071679 RepID=UPI0038B8B898